MERSFADAANCHGLKRARWRGLWKQAIQDLFIATVQNLRKLLRHLSQTEPELAHELNQFLQTLYTRLQVSLNIWLPNKYRVLPRQINSSHWATAR